MIRLISLFTGIRILKKDKLVLTSDTQLHRQAGNSIVVNVLMEIFKKLLLENTINVKTL